jgi:hypothetical protein
MEWIREQCMGSYFLTYHLLMADIYIYIYISVLLTALQSTVQITGLQYLQTLWPHCTQVLKLQILPFQFKNNSDKWKDTKEEGMKESYIRTGHNNIIHNTEGSQ